MKVNEKIILNKNQYVTKDNKIRFVYAVLKEEWKDKKKIGYKVIDVISDDEYELLDKIKFVWQQTETGGYYRTLTKEELEKENEVLPFDTK